MSFKLLIAGAIRTLVHSRSGSTSARTKPVANVAVKGLKNVKPINAPKPIKALKTVKTTIAKNHIDLFFARFPSFDYRPTAPYADEFIRLKDREQWEEREERRELRNLQKSMAEQFAMIYGTNQSNLPESQRLRHGLQQLRRMKRGPKTPAGWRPVEGTHKKTRKGVNSKGGTRGRPVPDHIITFFSKYPEFDYDPDLPFIDEFYRMCDYFGWPRKNDKRDEARDAMHRAMTLQFNDAFGTNAEDLTSWQKLCEIIQIDPVPGELEACRRAVKSSYVNICDLLAAPYFGTAPTRFPTEVALSVYTRLSGCPYPRGKVEDGSLLEYLLRHILNPRPERGTKRKKKGT